MVSVIYDSKKHITTQEIERLGVFGDSDLADRIKSYETEGLLYTHSDNGSSFKFMDRLHLGRDIHASKNGREHQHPGLAISRYFTVNGQDPFDSVGPYERRVVKIERTDGSLVFRQEVEVPKSWNDDPLNVVAQKYFFKPDRKEWKEKIESGAEYTPRQLFGRVTKFFGNWGERLGYFRTQEDRQAFEDELNFLQINQMGAFNSPVYFNAGIWEAYGIPGSPAINYAIDPKTGEVKKIEEGCYIRPQVHACFIAGPEDDLESIANHAVTEVAIFSNGSGVGHDIGELRAEGESLSGGGKASGPMSFFSVYDAWAGTVKSGGKSRRAARMTTMQGNHPDIMEFINAKTKEEFKALTLMKQGFSGGLEGEAYTTIKFQNTNLSARLPKSFFEAVERGERWPLFYIKSKKLAKELDADRMLKEIAFSSWRVGDPGIQFTTPIDEMNTCPNSGHICSSNPCSEYMFLNDTSCNLASLNLLKFSDKKGNFDIKAYRRAAHVFMVAQDIANTAGSYPNEAIARKSPEFRTTGLGYINLGALLMRKGIPYDSDEGRAYAGLLTALIHGQSNLTSTEMARDIGTFVHYEMNKEPLLRVMEKHRSFLNSKLRWDLIKDEKAETETRKLWDAVLESGTQNGFRNGQTTVLAPTGTISFLMGGDTTGVEPPYALKQMKFLAGGGTIYQRVQEISNALKNLGYNEEQIKDITKHVDEVGRIKDAPHIKPEDLKIFETAAGDMPITPEGHIKMIGATQPWISGAISKTINMPHHATVKEVYEGFKLANELDVKALSIFRDKSKAISVLTTSGNSDFKELKRGEKRGPPMDAEARNLEVRIGDTKLQIVIAEYEDGTPCKIFVNSYKSGSTMNAVLTQTAVAASKLLQYGMPLEEVIKTLIGQECDPKGITNDPHIQIAKSPMDYLGRKLAIDYLGQTHFATDPESIDITKLRGFKNGAMRVYEREKIDDWNIDQVLRDPEYGGFVPPTTFMLKLAESKKQAMTIAGNSGVACKVCGNMMQRTKPNCYECKCGYNEGSCSG